MQYRDVVIHTNAAIFGNAADFERFPPISGRVDLSNQIWLGPLDSETARHVMDTCEPKVFGIMPPVRQYAQLYAFVRELPPNSGIDRWDEENQLTATLAVSRLIHPTSIGFAYAARIGQVHDRVKCVHPARIRGISADVFLSPRRTRDWLVDAEANRLSELVPLLSLPLPPRIHNALWHHEYAVRTYYLDQRWTLVCTGLEALVHTNPYRNTLQFTLRVTKLASEVGISLSETDARGAYDMRSRLAHGVSFLSTSTGQSVSASQIQVYDRLEDTLRLVVLRGIQDKSFADIFRDDDQIRDRWPI